MRKERFEYLCSESEAGRDAFVRHSLTNEEGMVTSCIMPSHHIVVKTTDGKTHCWNFHECEDLKHPKSGPMV